MLASLSIENFALIEKLNIDFSGGFSIITGETGAGKSILLGALGLALGKRADLSSLKNKDFKCIIEARFSVANYSLQEFFEENDLDYDDETIIRREILPTGKSRAFINDSPVNLQQLQDLGDFLIDIHSQHETRELSQENFQFRILDAIANNKQVLDKYVGDLKDYKYQSALLESLKRQLAESQKEQDYNNYLLEELLAAKLVVGEQQELEAVFLQLSNVETIRESFDKALSLAEAEEFGIIRNLKEFKSSLQKISAYSDEYNLLSERSSSTIIEFSDIVSELSALADKLSGDPQQLALADQKLQTIYNLQKKHQVRSVEELIAIREELDNKLLSGSTLQDKIASTELALTQQAEKLDGFAAEIHKKRIAAVPKLAEKLTSILQLLGMKDVRFQIEVTAVNNYLANGKDAIEFLFSANKGSDFGLLKKVASGGELSRIMLAVKSILAQYSKLPVIIFDEIDTGVSGEIANKMGDIMKEMSSFMQVFAITHLPQIAAKGEQHFKVFKSVANGQTQSELKLLDQEQRVTEIAQMLSGSAVSDSAINHAKALLN